MNLTIDNTTCEDIVFNGHYLEKLYFNEHLVWEKQHGPTVGGPLKFTAEQAGSAVKLEKTGSGTSNPDPVLSYSTDGVNWNSYTINTLITLTNVGDYVMFKGTNSTFSTSSNAYIFRIRYGRTAVSGDVTSLFNEVGGDIPMPSNGCRSLFFGDSLLTTAPNLPSTTLGDYCYMDMFENCSALVQAPALPATTLAIGCYREMFAYCSSLTKAPVLPATIALGECYHYMFRSCTSLTEAPALPATTLNSNCYDSMFMECTNLIAAPELPATVLANYCYQYMFSRCTSLEKVPVLPATTLTTGCYIHIFYDCSLLKEIVCLATDISATNCLNGWLGNVAANGTFYKNPTMNDFVVGTNIPTGWTIKNYN